MGHDLCGSSAVIDVSSHALGEDGYRPVGAGGVATVTGGDKVCGLVAATVVVTFDVIECELGAIFDGGSTVTTGHTVTQVDGESFFFAYPVHALATIGVAVAGGVFHSVLGLMFPCWPGSLASRAKGKHQFARLVISLRSLQGCSVLPRFQLCGTARLLRPVLRPATGRRLTPVAAWFYAAVLEAFAPFLFACVLAVPVAASVESSRLLRLPVASAPAFAVSGFRVVFVRVPPTPSNVLNILHVALLCHYKMGEFL